MLEDHAVRVRQSVLEARTTKSAADRLADRIGGEVAAGDSRRLYAIGAHGPRQSRAIGGAPLPEAQDFWSLRGLSASHAPESGQAAFKRGTPLAGQMAGDGAPNRVSIRFQTRKAFSQRCQPERLNPLSNAEGL